MDRRSFLTAAAAASITLALTACGDQQIGGVTGLPGVPGVDPGGTGGLRVRVSDFSALGTVGGVARVTTTGTPIAIYRSGATAFQAFSMSCPHAGTTVNITSSGFTCPNHNARFAKDGTWLGGQVTNSLVSIPVTYDAATDMLTINGVPAPAPGAPGGVPTGGLQVRIADFAALGAVGGVARVSTTGTPIAVYRSAASTFQVFSMSCPHQGTTVNITAAGFTCPNHNARFAKDGTWLGGQVTSSLVSIPSSYDAATGILTISGVPAPVPGGSDDDDDDVYGFRQP